MGCGKSQAAHEPDFQVFSVPSSPRVFGSEWEKEEPEEVNRVGPGAYTLAFGYEDDEEKAERRKALFRQKWLAVVAADGACLEHAEEDVCADKEVVSAAVANCGCALEFAAANLRGDKEVVLAAVANSGLALRFASSELHSDKEVVAKAVASNPDALRFAHMELRSDRDVMLEAIGKDAESIVYVDESLWSDRAFVLKAVAKHGTLLKFASEDLRKDEEIVMEAVASNREAMKFAHEDLRGDKDFMMHVVATDARVLEYADEDIKADRNIVRRAVARDDQALLYAHEDLWADKEVMMKAVARSGSWLKHAKENMQEDKDVVLMAIANDNLARWHVSRDLKADKAFMMEAEKQWWVEEVGRYPNELWKAPDYIKNDQQVVFRAILQLGNMMRKARDGPSSSEDDFADGRVDDDVLKSSLAQANHPLQFAHEDIRANRQIVLQAVMDWGCALQFAHMDRRADKFIVMKAVTQEGRALKFASEALRADREVVMQAVSQNGLALAYAHEDLRKDREVALRAVEQHVRAFDYAGKAIQEDKEIVLLVLRTGYSPRLNDDLERDLDVIRTRMKVHSGLCRGKRISYKGRIVSTPSRSCIASFPGVEARRWAAMTADEATSVACVFLANAEDGLGKHGSTCRCKEIYGTAPTELYILILDKPRTAKEKREYPEKRSLMKADAEAMGLLFLEEAEYATEEEWEAAKNDAREKAPALAAANLHRVPWGCLWFEVWIGNIESARRRNQDLLVYFLPGKVNEGIVPWGDLSRPEKVREARLGSGLCNSQRVEVAWLNRRRYPWKALDLGSLGVREFKR